MVAALLIAIASSLALQAQNTEATVLGTVKDPSGAVVAGATRSTHESRDECSSARRPPTSNGDYRFAGVEIGSYGLTVEAAGLSEGRVLSISICWPANPGGWTPHLKLGTQAQSVDVQATDVPNIQTDTSNIAETKTGRELVDLPVAIATRAAGSTSAISTLTTQPGVQTDAKGNLSVAGGNPSQLSVTIDGISVMGPKAAENGPIAELFPSFYAIEEIRVSEVINPAEFGGVADITTITREWDQHVSRRRL